MSAILSRAASSNLVCLSLGGAFVQLSVLLLLGLLGGGKLAGASLLKSSDSATPSVVGGDLRSFDDLECSSLLSRWERSFAGVFKV